MTQKAYRQDEAHAFAMTEPLRLLLAKSFWLFRHVLIRNSTYGIAGSFFLHDSFHDHGGFRAWLRQPIMATLNALTFAGGAFICVAGTYVGCSWSTISFCRGLFL